MSYSLNDPRLQALEARLASLPPQMSTALQQQILYQCAFGAGRSSASRTLRRWQAAVAGLFVLLVGMSLPRIGKQPDAARRGAAELARAEVAPEPIGGELELSPLGHRAAHEISLDAWQVQSQAETSFERELAQFAKSDARLRSLAVGMLTRRVLEE